VVENMSPNTTISVLADGGRRHVLRQLVDAERPLSEDALARELAAHRAGVPRAEVGESDVVSARLQLFHRYLPQLADWGLVRHDRESGTAELLGDAASLRRLLNRVDACESLSLA
jgi:hypothetical protein